jgi:hypothetical protein
MDARRLGSDSCWRRHAVDNGVLAFHRKSGTNVLHRGTSTRGVRRTAPRVLQVSLLTRHDWRKGGRKSLRKAIDFARS